MLPYTNWITEFNPNFPTTFTDAASYLEQLERCYKKMYEILCYVEGLKDELQVLAENAAQKKYNVLKKDLESQISNLQTQILNLGEEISNVEDSMQAALDKSEKEIYQSIQQLRTYIEKLISTDIAQVQNEINILSGKLENFREAQAQQNTVFLKEIKNIISSISEIESDISDLQNEQVLFKDHVNKQFSDLTTQLLKKIDDQIARIQGDLILVTNPLTGKTDQLRDVLAAIADYKQPFPIKFETFNGLEIPFEDFNSMNITFLEFNNYAGLIFWKDLNYPPFYKDIQNLQNQLDTLKKTVWLDYLSGELESPYLVVKHLTDYVIERTGTPITFEQFNERNYTFEQFNAWEMTINEFNQEFRSVVIGKS